MISGLGQILNGGQAGPRPNGSKNHGTHNAPLFPGWNFLLFQSRENTVLLNLGCGKLKDLMHILNEPEGEVCSDTKRMGSTHFPTRLRHMVP